MNELANLAEKLVPISSRCTGDRPPAHRLRLSLCWCGCGGRASGRKALRRTEPRKVTLRILKAVEEVNGEAPSGTSHHTVGQRHGRRRPVGLGVRQAGRYARGTRRVVSGNPQTRPPPSAYAPSPCDEAQRISRTNLIVYAAAPLSALDGADGLIILPMEGIPQLTSGAINNASHPLIFITQPLRSGYGDGSGSGVFFDRKAVTWKNRREPQRDSHATP
jgi:hypothetical protein